MSVAATLEAPGASRHIRWNLSRLAEQESGAKRQTRDKEQMESRNPTLSHSTPPLLILVKPLG
jgi:hypothetical protein